MLECPTCSSRLMRARSPAGVMFVCGKCSGRAVAFAVLRKQADPSFMKQLRMAAYAGRHKPGRACPHCTHPMTEVRATGGRTPLMLDVCTCCHVVWFDPTEYQDAIAAGPPPVRRAPGVPPPLPHQRPPPPPAPPMPEPTARPALAGEAAVDDDELLAREGPDSAWKYVPGILGMPVEMRSGEVKRFPAVTWGLTTIMVALFLLLLGQDALDATITRWGFIPNQWSRESGLTLLTSFFLHAGLFHLIGNMYFFLIFGDNVESQLGTLKFFGLLIAAHLTGSLLHGMLDPSGSVPCVGASAGISGVLAYYAIAFPNARIGLFFWFFLRWLRLKAIWALLLYAGMQLFGAWQQIGGVGTVSYLAHLGGLAVGAAAAVIMRAGSNPKPRY